MGGRRGDDITRWPGDLARQGTGAGRIWM